MAIAPLEVYGPEVSYFTGKLEAYLRFKEIPYERIGSSKANRALEKEVGVFQVPFARLADGRVMSDTTPMIQWLEGEFPEPPVIPADPLQRFVSLLLEDYGLSLIHI